MALNRSFRAPSGTMARAGPHACPDRRRQELLGEPLLVHLIEALDHVAVRRDEAVRVQDESAPRLVDGVRCHLMHGSGPASHRHLRPDFTADENDGRLDAEDAGLELSLFSGADCRGPQAQEEAAQDTERHRGQPQEAAAEGSLPKPTNPRPHGRMRIPELSVKGKPGHSREGLAVRPGICRIRAR